MTARTYRVLFISLGVLFALLGILAFVKTLSSPLALWLGGSQTIRSILCFLCFALASAAFTCGFQIRAEREACQNLVWRAKRKLRRHLERKKIELGIKGSLHWGEKPHIRNTLHHAYQMTLHHIDEHRDEALHKLQLYLAQNNQEKQIQQTLEELENHLNQEINRFLSQELLKPSEHLEDLPAHPPHNETQNAFPAQDSR